MQNSTQPAVLTGDVMKKLPPGIEIVVHGDLVLRKEGK